MAYSTPPPPALPIARQYPSPAARSRMPSDPGYNMLWPTLPHSASELSLGLPVSAHRPSQASSMKAPSISGLATTYHPPRTAIINEAAPSIAPTIASHPSRRSSTRARPPSTREGNAPTLSEHGNAGRVSATILEDHTWPRSRPTSPTTQQDPESPVSSGSLSPCSERSSPTVHTSHWIPSYAATHSGLASSAPLPEAGEPVLYDPYYSSQLEQRRPPKARFFSLHFCGWHQIEGKCCVKPTFQGDMQSKNVDHLPVCHDKCWRRERDRLKDKSWHHGELPLCHRGCYLTKMWQLRSGGCQCDHCLVQVVPHNRSLREKLGWPTLVHFFCKECASHGVL